MPYVTVDVDLSELYGELDRLDKTELAEMLSVDGLAIQMPCLTTCMNIKDRDWQTNLEILAKNRGSLYPDEEEIINKIASRFK